MTDNTPVQPVAIPHAGVQPEWLEDDATVFYKVPWPQGKDNELAQHVRWNSDWRLYLPADHWAAPVLRLGGTWTPWNAALQGDGPPKDYAGGKVLFGDGSIVEKCSIPDGWRWWSSRIHDDDIIGYEATTPQPEAVSAEAAKRSGERVQAFVRGALNDAQPEAAPATVELLPCPKCGDDEPFTDYVGRVSKAGRSADWWDVECSRCLYHTAGYPVEAEAIAAWNTRPAHSGDAALVEARKESLVRTMYDAWPHTVISHALAEATGLPLDATIDFDTAKRTGAHFGALERYADAILATHNASPAPVVDEGV